MFNIKLAGEVVINALTSTGTSEPTVCFHAVFTQKERIWNQDYVLLLSLWSCRSGCNSNEIKRFGNSDEIPTDCRENQWHGQSRKNTLTNALALKAHTLSRRHTHILHTPLCILPEQLQAVFLGRVPQCCQGFRRSREQVCGFHKSTLPF